MCFNDLLPSSGISKRKEKKKVCCGPKTFKPLNPISYFRGTSEATEINKKKK